MKTVISRNNFIGDRVFSILWIVVNFFGIVPAKIGSLINQPSIFIDVMPPLYRIAFAVLALIINVSFFGFLQIIFFKIMFRGKLLIKWALTTWLAFIIVILMELFVIPKIVFSWLEPLLTKYVSSYSGVTKMFDGVEILASKNVMSGLVIAIALSTIIGVSSGLILGSFQAALIHDKNLAKKWLINVAISIAASIILSSVFYTAMNYYSFENTSTIKEYPVVGAVIWGIFYGLMTKQNVREFLKIQ